METKYYPSFEEFKKSGDDDCIFCKDSEECKRDSEIFEKCAFTAGRILPPDTVALPRELTAEHKIKFAGSFDFFDGISTPLSWKEMQQLYKKIVEHFDLGK